MRDPGMTLRDWFAGKALTGIISRMNKVAFGQSVDCNDWSMEAGDAYRIADAMLEKRREGK